MLRPKTRLVAMDAVCGETGTVWNTREVRQIIGPKVLLHIDASQAPLTQKISRSHFSADTLALDSAKVAGPRGIGCLVAHRTIPLTPLYRGGGQERGLRSGSEAPELARGFADALGAAVEGREVFVSSAKAMRAAFIATLEKGIPNLLINVGSDSAPAILNLSLPGHDTDYLVALLDNAGFAVSTRSACESDSEAGSRAVLALTGDQGRASATLRISWGPDTRSGELLRLAAALRKILALGIV